MISQNRSRKTALTVVLFLLLALLVVWFYHHFSVNTSSAEQLSARSSMIYRNSAGSPGTDTHQDGSNTLVVFTGRWELLRVFFPYVYRELRKNGGVLDRILFMMINYDNETLNNLQHLAQLANKILKQDVFELRFMGYSPGKLPPSNVRYVKPYYELFAEMITNSSNKYFKMDDDIVYIHPGTFKNMIENKNSQLCFLHSANIVSNWRCDIKHQELGVYNTDKKVNPKNLTFDFDPPAQCGWKITTECAELSLRIFIHHYHQGQLDKYQFNGLELLHKKERFSINLFMLDRDLIDIKAMLETVPILRDDEQWWTRTYAGKFKQPSCIVGRSFVVHFAYRPFFQKMVELGLLSEFETIVQQEVGALMEKELWDALKFTQH